MKLKTRIYFKIISFIRILFGLFHIPFKKTLLIGCFELFHYHHLKPVVDKLIADGKVNVFLLENQRFNKELIPKTIINNELFIPYKKAKFKMFDMSISLDYGGVWVPHGGLQLFTPHGDGMKSNYTGCEKLSDYDVVFSVGGSQYEIQKPFLAGHAKLEKIGFIINDDLYKHNYDKKEILAKYNIKSDKPIVLYAPSWCNVPENIIMTEDLLISLAEQTNYKIIFKPHPNLLVPSLCGGFKWDNIFQKLENNNFQIIYKSTFPIQELMYISDLLISDISSVIFEYLYLNKPIILHVNDQVVAHYDGEESFANIYNATYQVKEVQNLHRIMGQAIEKPDEHSSERIKLLKEKYYNIGDATIAAVNSIYTHLNIDL